MPYSAPLRHFDKYFHKVEARKGRRQKELIILLQQLKQAAADVTAQQTKLTTIIPTRMRHYLLTLHLQKAGGTHLSSSLVYLGRSRKLSEIAGETCVERSRSL